LSAVEYTEENDKLKAADRALKLAKSKRTALKERLKAMRKARVHPETSIHSRLEDILKFYGI
jgi:vacuolar-type H+-ATPase subunit D/Vma8